MKFRLFLISTLFPASIVFSIRVSAQAADPSSIIGKVVCGYQGWFNATGDGSPVNRWVHWSIGTPPQAGIAPNPNPNLDFDVYPDISVYNPLSLFQTNFANMGNGDSAKLFSSYKQDVSDKHFELMQKNGIDGIALQRFISEVLIDPVFKTNRDTIAVHVRRSAENYQRLFYITYDLSGLNNFQAPDDQTRFDDLKNDWTTTMIGNLTITSSPMYARQGGKPVIELWGIGFKNTIGTAAQQLDLINWFKSQGCYVIIGVPAGWRSGNGDSQTGWIGTYSAGDMISPWTVGGYIDQASTDNFKTNIITPDLTYCNSKGIAYQPVIFPGFSWSNWNGGPQNQIKRNKGEFFWHQATNLRSLGISTAYIAMFDEYDEGTAIMNMADGYDMIPTNQYFVTSSADGTYLSSDFYLRLTGKVSRVIKTLDASTQNVTILYSNGPIFFRTSNEQKYDPIASVSIYLNKNMSGTPTCTTVTGNPHRGLYSLKINGIDNSSSTSYTYFNAFAVNIPVSDSTELSFWTNPANSLGRYISVDLLFTDGTALRDAGAIDQNGISMHPAAGRGTVGTWTKTTCQIGNFVKGKTIKTILIAYDHGAGKGTYTGYIDDISINEKGTTYSVLPLRLMTFTAKPVKDDVLLQWQATEDSGLKQYEIERSTDGTNFNNVRSLVPSKGGNIKTNTTTDLDALNIFSNSKQLYYRLKSVDLDNKFSYSKVQVVNLKRKSVFAVNPFPNPFTDRIDLTVNAEKDGFLNVAISDASGKTIVNKKIGIIKGQSKVTINDLGRLTRGVYFLKLTSVDETATFKMEK